MRGEKRTGEHSRSTVDWNWAQEPQDGSESWTPDVRMHVASLSKIITAIAMTKLFLYKLVADAYTSNIVELQLKVAKKLASEV